MSIFVIFRVQQPQKIKEAIEQHFPGEHLSVGPGEWLLSAKGTAKDISDKIGITSDENKTVTGPAIVIKVDGYFGRASKDIWDWIKVKIENEDG